MRAPRPTTRSSRRRLIRRGQYQAYMTSPTWFRTRRQWYAAWARERRVEPVCAVCGKPWTLRDGHLHHRTYARLGRELPTDLVPLCRPDHERLHALWDAHPSWRGTGRATATLGIIAALRRRQPSYGRVKRNRRPAGGQVA